MATRRPVGLLPACLILTIMIVPIVASLSRELFLSVPSEFKQGAMALGTTRWEMVRRYPSPRSAVDFGGDSCWGLHVRWARRLRSLR